MLNLHAPLAGHRVPIPTSVGQTSRSQVQTTPRRSIELATWRVRARVEGVGGTQQGAYGDRLGYGGRRRRTSSRA